MLELHSSKELQGQAINPMSSIYPEWVYSASIFNEAITIALMQMTSASDAEDEITLAYSTSNFLKLFYSTWVKISQTGAPWQSTLWLTWKREVARRGYLDLFSLSTWSQSHLFPGHYIIDPEVLHASVLGYYSWIETSSCSPVLMKMMGKNNNPCSYPGIERIGNAWQGHSICWMGLL